VQTIQTAVGIVIIGRNEGSRLVRCLDSLSDFAPQMIYVDSASTDHSLAEAKTRGAHVVSLDMSQSFTAARARNTGFDAITALFPEIKFVQFVDGDCIVNSQWIKTAVDFLYSNPEVAVACGRRRELFPQHSIYNQMCDQEWNTPVGEAKACGGDALMRADVMKLVGGYNNHLIAGEEPELCIRIRKAGYRIWRIDAEMTLHDAAITKFGQWWKRAMRTGYAYAEGSHLHGAAPECHWVAESRRAWIWGLLLPFFILSAFTVSYTLGLLLFCIYPLQVLRLTFKNKQLNKSAFVYSFFMIMGKFAEVIGQVKFWSNKFSNKKGKIIEYK